MVLLTKSFSQNLDKISIEKVEILLKNNHSFDAEIIETLKDSLKVKVNNKYIISISKETIKTIETPTQIMKGDKLKNKEFFKGHYFFQNNTLPLNKGEFQYSNFVALYQNVSYGISDKFNCHFMIGYFPDFFVGEDSEIDAQYDFYITPQYYIKLDEVSNICFSLVHNFRVSSKSVGYEKEREYNNLGILNLTLNSYKPMSKLSVGSGIGYSLIGYSTTNYRPFFALNNGKLKIPRQVHFNFAFGTIISKKSSLFSEMYYQSPIENNINEIMSITFAIKKDVSQRFTYTYGLNSIFLNWDKIPVVGPTLSLRYNFFKKINTYWY
jgi:hypothetical protein